MVGAMAIPRAATWADSGTTVMSGTMRTSLRPTLQGDGISPRADFEHAHRPLLGELRLDLARLDRIRPGGRRQGVGHAPGHVAASDRSRSTWLPLPEICARILGSFCCRVRRVEAAD